MIPAPRIAVLDDYLGCARTLAEWRDVEAIAEVEVFAAHVDPADAAGILKDFDILVSTRERMAFPAEMLWSLPRLKLIVVAGQAHSLIDLDAARERGIEVRTLSGIGPSPFATVEIAWGLILGLARNLHQEAAGMRDGYWQRSAGRSLAGQVLGIIGLGRLGSRMPAIARAFGMDVIAWSPGLTAERAETAGVRVASKAELLASADWVSLHLRLSNRTRHNIGTTDFARMKDTAYLINTARGGLVDTDALVSALRDGRIAGAGLDCFEEEPLAPGHILRRLPNVLSTPHLGFAVQEELAWLYRGAAREVRGWLVGSSL